MSLYDKTPAWVSFLPPVILKPNAEATDAAKGNAMLRSSYEATSRLLSLAWGRKGKAWREVGHAIGQCSNAEWEARHDLSLALTLALTLLAISATVIIVVAIRALFIALPRRLGPI